MEDTFKCFGEEDFDVKKWVNAQVRSSEALASASGNAKGTSVDDHLATLVVKLQLLTQSSSKAIDEQSTVCSCCPPRPPSFAPLLFTTCCVTFCALRSPGSRSQLHCA